MFNPPLKGAPFELYISLESQASPGKNQNNPTLAAADFRVSKDGGALAALGTTPSVSPASSDLVHIQLTATEMSADNVTIICSDDSGDQWYDCTLNIQPVSGIATYSAVNDGSATTTSFVTDLTEGTDDHYNGLFLVFVSGDYKGQSRKISDYDGTSKTITLEAALAGGSGPADNDEFIILGRSE